MSKVLVNMPPQYIGDTSRDKALFNAKVYVGEVDLDPRIPANQKTVTAIQEDGTEVSIPQQPIRTNAGGYYTYNGSVVTLFVDGAYSMAVDDRNDNQKFYYPNAAPEGIPVLEQDIATTPEIISGEQGKILEAEGARANFPLSVDTLADLRALTGLVDNQVVYLNGHTAAGVGGGEFVVVGNASSEVDDGGITLIIDGKVVRRADYDYVTPEMFGADPSGVSSSTTAIRDMIEGCKNNDAYNVLFSGKYRTGQFDVDFQNDVESTFSGVGDCQLIAEPGSQPNSVRIMNVQCPNVTVTGVNFNGNSVEANSFDVVARASGTSSNLRFHGCTFTDCRGIALFCGGISQISIKDCRFKDCGIYNRTTGQNSDRRQAFASSTVTDIVVDGCYFEDVGLDCISIATNSSNVVCVNNTIINNDAGSIYISRCDNATVSSNIVNNQGGGNGIDIPNSTNVVVSNNLCYGNGASGILIADTCSNVNVSDNICRDNFTAASTHQGGITLYAVAASTISNVTISGNRCYDTRAPGSVTQKKAIDIQRTHASGIIEKLKIDSSNQFSGYNSSGAPDLTGVLRQVVGTLTSYIYSYPIVQNYATMTTRPILPDDAYGTIEIIDSGGNDFARVFFRNGSLKILEDPDSIITIGDSGSVFALYLSGSEIIFKNRFANTRLVSLRVDNIIEL